MRLDEGVGRLTEAVQLAMQRAVDAISVDFTEVIVDGNYNFLSQDCRSKCLIKADDLVPAVSAASIIAKVARDEFMRKLTADFPEYGFEKHVGYGTKLHAEMLAKHGVCAQHRRSFAPIKRLLDHG
jgi:ribonuclease HII